MSTKHLLLEELHTITDAFPTLRFTVEGMPRLREVLAAGVQWGDAEGAGVKREAISIPGAGVNVPALLYTPAKPSGAAYLHIHGGGYIIGSAKGSDIVNLNLCRKLGITILSVDYRLAPEHPIPAPLDDCYAGLAWLHQQAGALGIDPSRIAVGGESAGGGLAAALAIKARDAGEYAVCHQHLTYPMLDDRTGTAEQPGDPLTGEFVWTRESNQFGWTAFLGNAERAAPQVPARVDDPAGLPPAWIFTVGLDLFRDENIAYANRLMAAGVHTELIVWPGACHGFQMVPGTSIGKRYADAHLTALGRALHIDV